MGLNELLANQIRRAADLADRDERVRGADRLVLEVYASDLLHVGFERGAKHHGLPFGPVRHTKLANDSVNVGTETHVQHPIGFVEDQGMNAVHHYTGTLPAKIHQATRRCREDLTALLELDELRYAPRSTIYDARANPRSVGVLHGVAVDLHGELSGRREDDHIRENGWAKLRDLGKL